MSSDFVWLWMWALNVSEISFLSRFFPWKVRSAWLSSWIFFSQIKRPEAWFTSSAVAPWAYHKTGTPIKSASAVPIPKLSLVRLMRPALCLRISMSCSLGSHQVKIIFSFARDLREVASGPSPIMMSGTPSLLKVWMMSPHSLTKFTSLPTQTK